MPARNERKIIKQGASKSVALPPDWLRAAGLDIGDIVDVIYGSVVLIKPKGMTVDRDLLKKELAVLAQMEEVGQADKPVRDDTSNESIGDKRLRMGESSRRRDGAQTDLIDGVNVDA